MKILICASEMVPFAKTGGLADVIGALPLALEDLGHEVVVSLPFYKSVKACGAKITKTKFGVPYAVIGKNVKVYFIENDAYYNRDNLYTESTGDFKDNLERFAFYSYKSIELLGNLKFQADIIHAHDWQASLIPIYLKEIFSKKDFYKDMRSVLTVHNLGYQGIFPKEDFPKTGLSWDLFDVKGVEFYGSINLLKGGIEFSDCINTVSKTYASEIMSPEFGFGLEGVLAQKKDKLSGIINGLDYSIWDPESDNFINSNFSLKDIEAKAPNKLVLQKKCNFPVKKEIPLLGIVSRLVEHKGFDILSAALEEICSMELQLVILGLGDAFYQKLLGKMAEAHPKNLSVHFSFDDALAHNIYAASDIFLMPSHYEPCGLGQLIGLRYGAIPLVFKTGGLADTINKENGFHFCEYSSKELIKTIKKAVTCFKNKSKWRSLMVKALSSNFSWENSAKDYIQLYEQARA